MPDHDQPRPQGVFWLRLEGVSLPGPVISDKSAMSLAVALLRATKVESIEVLCERYDGTYWRRIQTRISGGTWRLLEGVDFQWAVSELMELRRMSAARQGPAAQERRAREVEAMRAEQHAKQLDAESALDRAADEQRSREAWRSYLVHEEFKKRDADA